MILKFREFGSCIVLRSVNNFNKRQIVDKLLNKILLFTYLY